MPKQNNTSNIVLFSSLAVAAGAAGYLLGTLLAPQSGKETRAKLKSQAKKLADAAAKHAEKVKAGVDDAANKANDKTV